MAQDEVQVELDIFSLLDLTYLNLKTNQELLNWHWMFCGTLFQHSLLTQLLVWVIEGGEIFLCFPTAKISTEESPLQGWIFMHADLYDCIQLQVAAPIQVLRNRPPALLIQSKVRSSFGVYIQCVLHANQMLGYMWVDPV